MMLQRLIQREDIIDVISLTECDLSHNHI